VTTRHVERVDSRELAPSFDAVPMPCAGEIIACMGNVCSWENEHGRQNDRRGCIRQTTAMLGLPFHSNFNRVRSHVVSMAVPHHISLISSCAARASTVNFRCIQELFAQPDAQRINLVCPH